MQPKPVTPTYRAFRLNCAGAIVSAEIIEADDDVQAKAVAAVMPNCHGIELWAGGRRLGRFPSHGTGMEAGHAEDGACVGALG